MKKLIVVIVAIMAVFAALVFVGYKKQMLPFSKPAETEVTEVLTEETADTEVILTPVNEE